MEVPTTKTVNKSGFMWQLYCELKPLDCDVWDSSDGALTLGPVVLLSSADLHSHGSRSEHADLSAYVIMLERDRSTVENNTDDVMWLILVIDGPRMFLGFMMCSCMSSRSLLKLTS